jgi:glutaredoxin-related protein
MVLKIYISGLSGNKEVKKRQQRVLMILESKHIPYETIDITEPGNEEDKQFLLEHGNKLGTAKYPLPPQLFMDEEYCGDYEQFDLSNDNDELEKFLKLTDEDIERMKSYVSPRPSPAKDLISNGFQSFNSKDVNAFYYNLSENIRSTLLHIESVFSR